jgi:Flp pilus assembly protein TadD
VRSDSPFTATRLGVLLAVCGLLLAGAVSGCTTTQETAATKQAESKRILEAREKRQQRKAHTAADGPKTSDIDGKSAHRQEGSRG